MSSAGRLRDLAKRHGVVLPAASTGEKYGWTEQEWLQMLHDQGWVCPICRKASGTGKYVTDHEHVRGWNGMPDERRKLYVRGVTCWHCNRYLLAKGITVRVAENVAEYLSTYEERKP